MVIWMFFHNCSTEQKKLVPNETFQDVSDPDPTPNPSFVLNPFGTGSSKISIRIWIKMQDPDSERKFDANPGQKNILEIWNTVLPIHLF
jgi:hypothetical protein